MDHQEIIDLVKYVWGEANPKTYEGKDLHIDDHDAYHIYLEWYGQKKDK
jgi:hypothetical protein